MINRAPECASCGKEISGNDVVYVKLRYPKMKGFAEVKSYLRNEGEMLCETCQKSR
ncbi:Fe3+ hydroxamate ABC transporter substrate-binding protein [Halobacillus mangrovi]|uniref:Fe3+ hydroxamate ABC transporter substrate-binding protein n=1 Tax=Halobacillus mangrovi TaxID=402384 RepID=UPI003D994916